MRSHGSRGSLRVGAWVAQAPSSNSRSAARTVRIVASMGTSERGPTAILATARARSTALKAESLGAPAAPLSLVRVVGQPWLARAHEELAHLVEARAVALALDGADVGGRQRQLVLLHRELQVAVGE